MPIYNEPLSLVDRVSEHIGVAFLRANAIKLRATIKDCPYIKCGPL